MISKELGPLWLAIGFAATTLAGCTDDPGIDPAAEDRAAFEDPDPFEDEAIGDEDPLAGDAADPLEDAPAGAGIVEAGPGDYPPFEEVDTDSDGRISREELAAVEGAELATLDTDQDGFVSRTEYMAAE